MRSLYSLIALLALVPSIIAAPTSPNRESPSHQLRDGLPNPNSTQLDQIEANAHGTLPNGPPPPVISNKGIVNLQLIAFNELFEVAFFNSLLTNITDNVPGYQFSDEEERNVTLRNLNAILAVSPSNSFQVLH